MVCKLIPGERFRGAISYNENKVKTGEAVFLAAGNYPKDTERLSFEEKLATLQLRADLNPKAEQKVQHLILSFSPKDVLNDDTMRDIAEQFMDKTGLGEQPFLVYRHNDAAHPHLHIVTTNIDRDGKRINMFRFGKYKAAPACSALEKEHGLVVAKGQVEAAAQPLQPRDIKPLAYGSNPTKGAISNIVRSVAMHYKYSSLAELNAALKQFNVIADRGKEGSAMYENKGLVYAVIDQKGDRIGRAVKASTIYEKPTLSFLQTRFEENKTAKTDGHKERLRRIIDDAIKSGASDKKQLARHLDSKGIYLLLRQNEEGRVYGITFVDNKSLRVFNGSDLGKNYSAAAILQRLADGDPSEILSNRAFTKKITGTTSYDQGFQKVLHSWTSQGMLVTAETAPDGSVIYKTGYALSDKQSFTPADKRMTSYLRANSYTPSAAATLLQLLEKEYALFLDRDILQIPAKIIEGFIHTALMPVKEDSGVDYRWAMESRKKKRRRRY